MKIVDMHCDTIAALWELRRSARGTDGEMRQEQRQEKGQEQRGGKFPTLRENEGHVDLRKLQSSGYLLQNFALFVDKEECVDPWEQVQKLYALYEEELRENQDIIAPVLQFADIEKNKTEGKISALLTVEEGAVCKGEMEKLCKLYEQGARMLTLTWNYPNELGYPNERETNTPDTESGLTEKGREFLAKMEELGMIADVSHLSDRGFADVLECTEKPFVASHSNARALCGNVRNLTDSMIRSLGERGGVMGLNFYARFLTETAEGEENPGTIAAVVEHAKHIVRVGGMEVLGLGSDFDGIDTHRELPHAGKMPLLYEALKKGGFTERQLDMIFAENVLRVYREVLR